MSKNPAEESIFDAARQLADPTERTAYLNRACQDNGQLRARIDVLLSAHGEAAFLESPAGDFARTAESPKILEQPGTTIGPFKLLEPIGEGGMGLVFMAEQTKPLRRRVALKIIKPGLDTRSVIARFEAERQALALMDHANIARVYDAGATESGRPYFVMELVRGVPITEYCNQRGLELRDRLELFMQVCDAVQHAHQKGIIHRDLKPTNILVAHDDTKPMPKIIDFGVAKATTQPLIDRTLFTAFAQIIGTPLYMSPEQAELNVQDVDTRSDIYSLGVVLYELLTGTTPFDKDRLHSVGPDEMRRIIREEDPPKPSTRATTVAAATTAISQRHDGGAMAAALALKGDLDWIVMKALEKDRRRRYDSASDLASDIRRYLRDEPVEAAAPTALYRARKFIRRHRARVAIGAVLLGACAVGIIEWGMSTVAIAEALDTARVAEQKANRDRDRFRSERDRAEANLYVANIRLAHEEWKQARVSESTRLLNAHLPAPGERDLRGWEWHYLSSLAKRGADTIGSRSLGLRTVEWSPDSSRLATTDENHDVKIWDASNLRELRTLHGHTSFIFGGVEWNPEGTRIASADSDGMIRVWNVQSEGVLEFKASKTIIRCIAWSPDGKQLASCGDDNLVKVWDAETGLELLSLEGHDDLVWCVAWSPDGERLASVDNYVHRTIRVWNAITGELLATKPDAHDNSIFCVAWGPDSKRLVTGSGDHLVKVWEVSDWKQRRLIGHNGEVTSVTWSADGAKIASSGRDGSVMLWNPKSSKPIRTLRGHMDAVRLVRWSDDGNRLASASWDGTVRVWEPLVQQEYCHFKSDLTLYGARMGGN
jgi:serine/threonine protein kinase/Tol biopolymer transport system component